MNNVWDLVSLGTLAGAMSLIGIAFYVFIGICLLKSTQALISISHSLIALKNLYHASLEESSSTPK